MKLDGDLIERAAQVIEGHVRTTPIEASPLLSELLGVPVHLKLEHWQVTGSFKVRGALFALSRLSEEDRRAGVATCSAGNHGKGLAYAGRAMGVPVTVYVPSTIDEAKHRGMLALGASVIRCDTPGYDDTEAFAKREAARLGRRFVSAFDDPAIMAGNGGTLAKEVLEAVPEATTFVLPVGGGGLSGGFSCWALERRPGASVIGCQHEGSPALALSLDRGEAVTYLPPIETSARALEGGLGALCFEELRERISSVALVSEHQILKAAVWLFENHQHFIEPSSAVTIAACLAKKVKPNGPTVVVLTGRNFDLGTAWRVLSSASC
jgi:threonine dehydratase